MKKLLVIILLLSYASSFAQRKMPPRKPKNKIDTLMIKRTGADLYGMKKYVMCFLRTGPNKNLSADSTKKIVAAHLQNITKLSNQGKLVLAGPFLDGTELEGIFIFNVTTVEEAKKLTDTDPGVLAGIFSVELHPWYGSAALMDIPLLHTKVQVKQF
ncbi:MAG TPA: YciI family protein [Bacteroidia bacterium]|nr:YciI family protein [Bacteroidia bacterium]